MRINARLDEEHTHKLTYLQKATGGTISDVIKWAIDLYYADCRAHQAKPGEILKRSGLIGCAEGSAELSENYKDAFGEISAAKHDHC